MREKDREAMNTMHCIEVSTTGKLNEVDIESGEVLYPGLSKGENQLRWGFIRKVYDILSSQLLLTTAISFVTVLHTPVKDEMEMAKAGGEVVVEKSNTCEECGASFKKPAYLKKPMQSHSPEIHDKLKELQSILKFDEGSCKSDLKEISRRHTSRSPLKIGESQSINEKASILMHFMVSR